ncbi:MAG: hypothetical protein CVT77_06465 [Alphaproteobacteria bacterium HGW-Alphaproteobacteria-16]|nr:MAG: hypothetical protein CVT77_06465 [Alphaproteobacteria bacterium HGW-Alphaproteobacteria-16]
MNAITGSVRLADDARRSLGRGGKSNGERVSPHRGRMIAKVHVAKKALNLVEDDYRQILLDETGHVSAKDCSDADLVNLLKRFERIGFKATAGKPGGARPASHPGAGKARALWISLYQLGVIHNDSEAALEAFARRQLKCERLQWANQALTYRLIEALKAMAQRAGWDQGLEGVATANKVIVLKRRLVEAQMERLRAAEWVHPDWDVRRTAREFGGVEIRSILSATLPELDDVARVLGRAIGDAKAAGKLK